MLAAVAVDGLRAIAAGRGSGAGRAAWVPAAICIPLILQGAVRVLWLAPDTQQQQRETVAAVHKVFPTPVPYIDHSGMIASFRKVNFFMSTWGVESYRAAGRSFMRDALTRYRPPLLLVNRGELDPDAYQFGWLLPEDQALIQEFYVPYWGPIRVAGARVQIPRSGSIEAHLPFPGRYRLEAATPVRIDGISRAPATRMGPQYGT